METKTKTQIVAFVVMLPFVLGLLQGCAPGGKGAGVMRVETAQPAFPASRPSQMFVFQIKEGDVLGFVFQNNPELNSEQTVRPDGRVSLRLIGDMVAAGLTPMQLEDTVLRAYTDFVADTRYSKVLKEGDYFDLKFVYNPELNIGVRVRSDGMVSLPIVGEVQAAGLTPAELRKILIKKYSKDLRSPDIALLVGENTAKSIHVSGNSLTVSVIRASGHRIYVMGEVKTPKAVSLDTKMSLLQALTEAGGATGIGDLSRVIILRRTEERKVEWLQADLQSPLESIDTRNDMLVHAGDIIVVPKTGVAKANAWVSQYIRDMIPVLTTFNINANLLSTGGVVP